MRYAFFVSPHGFGHAARAVAVMNRLSELDEQASFIIVTLVPDWFFSSSLPGVPLEMWPLATDVGFVQRTSIEEDLSGTVDALNGLYPLDKELVSAMSARLRRAGIDIVVADIAVIGIESARQAGLPVVLIENFTWDFIYAAYFDAEPRLRTMAEYLAPLFERATLRLQAEPICRIVPGAEGIGPIARAPRAPALEIRSRLGVSESLPLVMLSMGGVPGNFPFIDMLAAVPSVNFLLAGVDQRRSLPDNVRVLSHHSSFYHPDLMRAADVIVGKVGYSTVCEAYFGRTQFFYVPRARFPESPVMEAFVREELAGREISANEFESGAWISRVPGMLSPVAPFAEAPRCGASEAARRILEIAG